MTRKDRESAKKNKDQIQSEPSFFSLPFNNHILISLLIILIGSINIVFGNIRKHQLNKLSIEINSNEAYSVKNPNLTPEPPLPARINLNEQTKQKHKIEHSLKFYSFVTQAGIMLISIGTIYLAILGIWQYK
jgi:hypothetical protein